MLAEESPDFLRQQYNAVSLEEVFLKLSVLQNMGKRRRSSIAQEIVEQVTVPAISNPALDLSDEQSPAEISGEFGDNISMSSAIRDPITSSSVPAPPLPPEQEMPTSFLYNLHVMSSHHLHALIWKNFLWMMRNMGYVATISQMLDFLFLFYFLSFFSFFQYYAVHCWPTGGANSFVLLCHWP